MSVLPSYIDPEELAMAIARKVWLVVGNYVEVTVTDDQGTCYVFGTSEYIQLGPEEKRNG